ncbi:hypothetical protein C8R43DRAFT_894926 [Mycena crocata]|nr:hypothetical protein C8R43DRAFT_894926 [Mycena crocata]
MSSPFGPFLGTNYCPTEQEIVDIKALLPVPTLRLNRLDDDIAAMQQAMDKLREERNGLVTYLDAHKALISPVRRLPLDIIQEIFIACLPTHRNCAMSAQEAPVLFGRICSSWRAVSLSTPRLWAKLHIAEPSGSPSNMSGVLSYDEKMAQRTDIARMWLRRAGQCPLSISVQGRFDFYDTEDDAHTDANRGMCNLMQELASFATRWEHIKFTVGAVSLKALAHLTETDVPLLRTIVFNKSDSRPVPIQAMPPSPVPALSGILRGARTTAFSISHFSMQIMDLPLRWDQLQVLSISDTFSNSNRVTTQTAVQVISRCTRLLCCTLNLDDGIQPEMLVHPVLEHPFLRTLVLNCTEASSPEPLLDHLVLPELRNLTLCRQLTNIGGDFTAADLSLARFFAGWLGLETLHTQIHLFSKSSLLDTLLSLPPTLERLQLDDSASTFWPMPTSLDDDVLAQFISPPGLHNVYCPSLQELVITRSTFISDAGLLRFITARMAAEPSPTLRRAEISFSRFPQIDILPDLEQFIECGLEVSIEYPKPSPARFSPWEGLDDV